jgi:hypothetical protein
MNRLADATERQQRQLRRRVRDDEHPRSIRNALDRARLRQAMRLCAGNGVASREALQTIEAEDIRASRVFAT